MLKVEIPIYFHTKETALKEELGLEEIIEDMRVDYVTFYSIDYVESYLDLETYRPLNKTIIVSSGKALLSPLSKEEVVELIDKALCQ